MAQNSYTVYPEWGEHIYQIATWTDAFHAQKQMNATNEKYGMLRHFNGVGVESISIALDAGTQADTIGLEIQGVAAGDTVNVTGFPDGTAVTNGTASVSNKGGTSEWVTWTFSTAPTPSGLHWIVMKPSSAGAFSIEPRYCADWCPYTQRNSLNAFEKLYTTAWSGSVTVGQTPMRVKLTDGTYLPQALTASPPFSTVAETVNNRLASSSLAVGVKFVAPYDMEFAGARLASATNDAYSLRDLVLVDSSDVELARWLHATFYTRAGYTHDSLLETPVTLTEGNTYRLYMNSRGNVADNGSLTTVTVPAGRYDWFNFASGEWEYTSSATTAGLPSGGWTDVATEIPLVHLLSIEDMSAITAGGGGVTPPTILTGGFN